MIYTNDREAFRKAFFTAWQKHLKKLPIDAIEAELIEIILLHPEYQCLFEKPSAYENQEFALEENPFLHLSLHLAIREQVRLNRPIGIAQIKQGLMNKFQNQHEAEHSMMTCLAQIMWSAQEKGCMPSETDYLNQLKMI